MVPNTLSPGIVGDHAIRELIKMWGVGFVLLVESYIRSGAWAQGSKLFFRRVRIQDQSFGFSSLAFGLEFSVGFARGFRVEV